VLKIAIDEHSKREKLKATRNLLFENFLKAPDDIRLALEIKRIDDQIAECTNQISRRETQRGARDFRSKSIST
jgi:hypothetical protein